MLKPIDLRCEYLINPIGIDVSSPRLSWVLVSKHRNQVQTAYQILVADHIEDLENHRATLWDSGRVATNQSTHVPYTGTALRSGLRCWWKVRVWDRNGQASDFSKPAFWQLGLLSASDWRAQWIWLDIGSDPDVDMKPCAFFRRVFEIAKPVQRAILYATARGLYECYLNGQRVGDAVLTPGWTDYGKRIQYQAYDVTSLLQVGDNTAGAILGDGWYYGHVGHKRGRAHYGTHPQFLAQLLVEFTDGSSTTLVTDATWHGSTGPIRFSDLLMGETYDARLELDGWDRSNFDASNWSQVQTEPDLNAQLVAGSSPPIRVTQELPAKTVTQRADGSYVLDFGQNMVGRVRLRVEGKAGATVRLRYAEILNPDGSLHTENLRSARATDTYILRGDGLEHFEPRFTFHGFRYVEASGYPGHIQPDAVTGRVLHSDLLHSGSFECSNPMVNKLWHNILWGQRGNFVSVPTDCPQRDERLGWMGDAQVFVRTACFNMESASFFSKWMIDVQDGQSADGAFPDVAPRLVVMTDGAPAWGDAGITVPWVIYQVYGDVRIIERHYDAMTRWMDYIHAANPHFLRTKRLNNNYGDWVSFDQRTSKELVATAYWAHSALLMSAMAQVVGNTKDAKKYAQLFDGIKAAFNTAYVHADGRIEGGSQTAYVLALYMELLPKELRAAATGYLVDAIQKRDWHLSTGFLGSAYLCPVLTEHGYTDIAYRLLTNETCPSWGYMVKHGATTIWERWNSWTAEDGIYEPGMNSFNHYAFGAIGEWLYRYVAGIDLDPARPGFEHIRIQPRPGGGLTRARAEYRSIRGPVVSDWHIASNAFHLKVSIPPNATATVRVPAAFTATVTESGQPPEQAHGIECTEQADDARVFRVGSGDYHFTVTPEPYETRSLEQ